MRRELVVVALAFSVTCVLERSGQLGVSDGGGGSGAGGGGPTSNGSGGSSPASSGSGGATSASSGNGGDPGVGGSGGTSSNGGFGGDGGSPPLGCDELFDGVDGYNLCQELTTECHFVANLGVSDPDCDSVCSGAGTSCIDAEQNPAGSCNPNGDAACDTAGNVDLICHCSKACGAGPACPPGQVCVGDPTPGCQLP
jgi:hypothetical protein